MRGRSQRVTQADLDAGRIRIPVTTGGKSLLPSKATRVEVVLKGVPLGPCAYNPRFHGGHDRSGVISVGSALSELVVKEEVLSVTVSRAGVVYLGDRGSKLRIAQWVETKRTELDAHLLHAASTLADFIERRALDWRAPGLAFDFRELSADLWSELELPQPDPATDGFWGPSRQPRWDAVAVAEGPHETRGVVLVEAKSHLSESFAVPGTSSSSTSRQAARCTIRRACALRGTTSASRTGSSSSTPARPAPGRHPARAAVRCRRSPDWT
jgi:hypothetical protein